LSQHGFAEPGHPRPQPRTPSAFIQVLVAEDDESLREILAGFLKSPDKKILSCRNGEEALHALDSTSFDLVITDLMMPGADGLDVLKRAKALAPECVVIIMTGYASLDTAIRAIRGGAYDYVRKPFKLEEMEIVIHNACEKILLVRENTFLLQRLRETMEELRALRQVWSEKDAFGRDPELSRIDETLSEMVFLVNRIPPDVDLQKKESQDLALRDLERLIHLRREGTLSEPEFSSFKRILLDKLK
jgi:DNA-binding response OmpR family regulator